jgi:GAF domain-containing protein
LSVQDYAANRFGGDAVRLLSTIAATVGVAIQSARLFETTQKNAHESAALNEFSRALAARLEESQILNEAYRSASQLLNTSNFFVALHDPQKNELRFPLDMIEGQATAQITIPLAASSMTAHVIRTQQPLFLKENVAAWKAEHGIMDVGQRFGAQSWLGVPLIIGGQVLGVMAVESYTASYAFTEHDRDLLNAIANQTAVALQNARLLEQTQRDAERERALNRIAGRLRNAQSVEQVLNIATQELRAATHSSVSTAEIAPGRASQTDVLADGNGHTARSEA